MSLFPSKATLAFLLKKKKDKRIISELNMYGINEIAKSSFKLEMIANAASVIPIENDPVLPTNILPLKLKRLSRSQKAKGM